LKSRIEDLPVSGFGVFNALYPDNPWIRASAFFPRTSGTKGDATKGKQSCFSRVLKNKHQTVSQGVRRFGKRSIFYDM